MNRRNVKKLRDFIAKLPPKNFRMGVWLAIDIPQETAGRAKEHTCGTVACLAGWASLLSVPSSTPVRRVFPNDTYSDCKIGKKRGSIESIAGRWMGLRWAQATRLFWGEWAVRGEFGSSPLSMAGQPLKDLAVRELDHLLETGKV